MNIQLLSISHKTACARIRAMFAFSGADRQSLMESILRENDIEECVALVTCNRTEIYTASRGDIPSRQSMAAVQRCMLRAAGVNNDNYADDEIEIDGAGLLRFYQDRQAVRHLFYVAAGLDSMVVGEDQILGQVKDAHQAAMAAGCSGPYLNMLFRGAVTAAKRIKTETKLSSVSVSTATLAVREAEDFLGNLNGKHMMVIGATGRIGRIIMKNVISDYDVQLFATSRQAAQGQREVISTDTLAEGGHGCVSYQTKDYTAIAFDDRYQYMDMMDVVISATSSPHYTITRKRWEAAIRTKKPRLLIDMAVPMDIEAGINDGGTRICHLDDLVQKADRNQALRDQAACEAREVIEEDVAEFERWLLFRDNMALMRSAKEKLLADAGGDAGKAIDKLFYALRENATPEELKAFYEGLARIEKEG